MREAIRTLEQEGWLVSEFGKGTRVRQLVPQEIEEIYEVRELLEGFMARKAAALLNEDQMAKLRKLATAADEAEQQEYIPGKTASNHDLNFHLALAGMIDNRLLSEFYQRLCNLGLLLVALSTDVAPRAVSTPHGDLVDAIESRQPDWAEAVARHSSELPATGSVKRFRAVCRPAALFPTAATHLSLAHRRKSDFRSRAGENTLCPMQPWSLSVGGLRG